MPIYAAILRGINVNGKNLIKMDLLREAFVSLGFTNVKTYIQSGNVVFESTESDKNVLNNQVSVKIKAEFGFEVPVIILSGVDLKAVFENNPFLLQKVEEINFLHVTFLANEPNSELVEKINDLNFGTDKFVILEKVVYLFCEGGYGITKLSNTFFESKLKQTATTRNWKTLTELVKMTNIPL